MTKKVYVHVGAHKTASTTIQENIRNNREFFEREHGISFLMSKEIAKSDFAHHFRSIAQRGRELTREKYHKSIQVAKASIEELIEATPTDDVFISWEGILGHCSLDEYGGIYTHSDLVAKSLGLIFEKYPTRVIMLIRKQDSFIESCYLQQVKEGEFLSFDEFVDKIDLEKISWKKVIDDFSENFGNNFLVAPFESIKNLGTTLFLENIFSYIFSKKFDLESIEITSQVNESMSGYGVEIAREIFPHLSEQHQKAMRRIIFYEFSSSKFGKATFFNKFTRRLIMARAFNDNLWVYNNHLNKFLSQSSLTSENFKANWLSFDGDYKEAVNAVSESDTLEQLNIEAGQEATKTSKGMLNMVSRAFRR
ncbi:hypothetical protein R3F64_18450 [Halomonas sp. 5021]|uniref:hypothetical protein n=1 Tax=Halomonas sp. 5021 TaxID=3082156 RepID=UPI002FC8265A